ncbi:hypothetical protein J6590_095691 [Homalodisca vitripennis]|nr:hypothetical protein J6590_095691 [Homalodisca vitripennis]
MPRNPEARLSSSLITTQPHSHPPQHTWFDVNARRTTRLRRCQTSSTPFRQILREESERVADVTYLQGKTVSPRRHVTWTVLLFKTDLAVH